MTDKLFNKDTQKSGASRAAAAAKRRGGILRAFSWFAIAALALQLVVGFLVFYFFERWDERSSFGDMFGVASCLFSGLALAGIILSLKFQSDELSLTRDELSRQFRLSLLNNVFSEMDRPEIHAYRNHVYKHFEKYAAIAGAPLKLEQLDSESYQKGSAVSNSFDRVGVLVLRDNESKDLVLNCFGPSIARSWVALEPMIEALRKGRYGPEHERFFDELAQEAIEQSGGRDRVLAMLKAWAAPGLGDEATASISNVSSIARHEAEVKKLAQLPAEAREAYWDAFYGSAESNFLFSDEEVGRFGVIAEIIRRRPGSSRVLDVGCGAGGLCGLLQPGDFYFGIDVSKTAVALASAVHPNGTFEAISFEALSPEGDPFDFVVLSEVLFYIDPAAGIKRAASLLKPETGRLILSIYSSPSGDALLRLLREHLDLLQEIQIITKTASLVWNVTLAKPRSTAGNQGSYTCSGWP